MSLLKEFKAFALKGNVVDLAVAVIIGAAFGKIVESLVKDVFMPLVGLALGGVDFKSLFINLGSQSYATLAQAEAAGAPVLRYGVFINSLVDFIAIALVVFIIVRALIKLKVETGAAAAPTEEVLLLRDIRDNLKNR